MADRAEKEVLLVDDDAAHRLMMRRALRRAFAALTLHEAACAADAHALLEAALHRLALAIIDFNLDHECGLEVLEAIRRRKTHHELPCIIVSTSDLEADMHRSYAAGCNCYVIKSGDPAVYQLDLTGAVRFLLSR